MNNEIENEQPVVDDKQMDIEWQYHQYLEKIGISKLLMHPNLEMKVKSAFMGGMAQMLLVWLNDLPRCTDEQADKFIGNLSEQIGNFFTNEAHKPLIILP